MAGSSVIGALRVSLGLDSAQFSQGATAAEKRAYQLGERIGKALRSPIDAAVSLKGAIGALGGALALKELAGATQRAFDYADAIQDLADRTGASTKSIQEFRYAAQLSGSSVEVADAATEKFARTLGLAQQGSDAQVKLFRSLGVTSKDFDTALRQTLDGIAKLPTVQQRAAVGFQIFGKSSATLTGLLGQGSAGFDQLAAKAEELGIVLKDDIIRNAGGANDKLDTLKMILNAQFANAVAQNANSIVSLADGIISLTGAVVKFLSSNPQTALAIIGGLAGSRGGPVGAAVGAVAGYGAGTILQRNADDGNNDLQFRRKQFAQARQNRRDAEAYRAGTGSRAISLTPANQEFVRQGQLLQKATAAAQAQLGTRNTGNIPTVGTGEAKTAAGKAASDAKRAAAEQKRAAAKALEDERRYQHDLGRARDDQLNAQLDLTADQTERVNIQQALLDNEHSARTEEIATDKDLNAAQKQQLTLIENGTYELKARLLHQQDQEALAQQALDSARAASDNQQDVLNATAALARTSKERGRIELAILDLQFAQLKAEQQVAFDNAQRRGDKVAMGQARDRLGTLDTLQGLARQKSARDNAGPLQQYLDGIPRGADEMNEALQKIEADGLNSLVDGLSNVEGGFKTLAATVKNVSNQIIASLVRIGLQKGIAALFSAIFPATRAAALPGGDSIVAPTSLLPARAKGGSVIAGKAYMVGEKGPEPFIPGRSGTIIPNDMLGGGRTMSVTQHITIPAGVDLATRTETYRLAGAIKDSTMAAIREEARRRA